LAVRGAALIERLTIADLRRIVSSGNNAELDPTRQLDPARAAQMIMVSVE
jgi:hypothetical protein